MLQTFLDMYLVGYTASSFNIVKFLLGLISIVFDVIFMIQHWYLYPNADPEEQKSLITQMSPGKNTVAETPEPNSAPLHFKS